MQGLIEIAWLACPLTAINNGQCYSGQDTGQWNYSITTTVQLHISEYLGTAVYNIPNGTIENVEVSTDPVAFDYPVSDLQKIYCLMATYLAPNISEYPEIDFASKSIRTAVVNGTGNDMVDVLEGLGNANSSDIEEKVKGKRFFVRAAKPAGSDLERVVFTTNDDGLDFLNPGRRYL